LRCGVNRYLEGGQGERGRGGGVTMLEHVAEDGHVTERDGQGEGREAVVVDLHQKVATALLY